MPFNFSDYLFYIAKYFFICKSYHCNAKFLKSLCSQAIIKFGFSSVVNRTIYFNNKSLRMTIKVSNIIVDRMLPAEFNAGLLLAQLHPQNPFRLCFLTPTCPGHFEQVTTSAKKHVVF